MDGAAGWDDYAQFYDWENAQTMARRDIAFWQRVAASSAGPIVELGCGTGRVTLPVARGGTQVIGVDLSAPMLTRARARVRRSRLSRRVHLVRADIRHLPFEPARFDLVIAPYGVLQSLLQERDLAAALRAAHAVLRPGGRLVLELVADLPRWDEYRDALKLRGWRPGGKAHLTLVESVRQDRARGVTIFEQEFVERRGTARTSRRFQLAFRTLSVPQMLRRLQAAGFTAAAFGGYDGEAWTKASETWIVFGEK